MPLWTPCEKDGEEALRVDASAAFGHPLVVDTTKEEVWRLVLRLKNEPKPKLVTLSNEKFRSCLAPPTEEGLERTCGDVLVFYCTRYLLDGRGVPFL